MEVPLAWWKHTASLYVEERRWKRGGLGGTALGDTLASLMQGCWPMTASTPASTNWETIVAATYYEVEIPGLDTNRQFVIV